MCIIIGRAGASPPSRPSGADFLIRSFGLAYRNCLRASFYAIFQFFLHWHCMHWPLHSLERTWASQLRQSMLTRTSTAHGDPSLAAPMFTARFSYTRGYGGACTSYIALFFSRKSDTVNLKTTTTTTITKKLKSIDSASKVY